LLAFTNAAGSLHLIKAQKSTPVSLKKSLATFKQQEKHNWDKDDQQP
jgi:hypothetical protein